MGDLLVRDVSPETKRRLAVRAAGNGRSVQAEAKSIIEAAVRPRSGSWVGLLIDAGKGAQADGFALPERHAARETVFER